MNSIYKKIFNDIHDAVEEWPKDENGIVVLLAGNEDEATFFVKGRQDICYDVLLRAMAQNSDFAEVVVDAAQTYISVQHKELLN